MQYESEISARHSQRGVESPRSQGAPTLRLLWHSFRWPVFVFSLGVPFLGWPEKSHETPRPATAPPPPPPPPTGPSLRGLFRHVLNYLRDGWLPLGLCRPDRIQLLQEALESTGTFGGSRADGKSPSLGVLHSPFPRTSS